MIRLHDNLSSGNGYKVRLLPAQLRMPYERIEYDIEAGASLPESSAILYSFSKKASFLPEKGCFFGAYPAVRAWIERGAARPGYVAVTEGH